MIKPRILIFSLAPLSLVGGAEIAVKEITDRLANQFEFEIISSDVKSFWSKYGFPIWACRRAAALHREQKFDLVWAIMANQAGMAAARFKKEFPQVPLLLTLQEGDDLNSLAYRLKLLGPKLFGVFRRADQIQAISRYLAEWGRTMGATCPIIVVPNGVDLNKFEALNPKSETIPKSKIIITTSRLVKKNGVDILIKALAFLPPDVKLQILGVGPEARALKDLTNWLKLASRVAFLGQVAPSELEQYLTQASVFARPSRSEGLGNSFLEAMAVGLPTVGTPVGGIPDFLHDGETGWLARVDDPKDLAEKISFIFNPANQAEVYRIAQAGQKLARENYSWETVVAKIKNIFNQLIV
ncbi:MAG: glycosyltransferase family 4 protein [Candidatus Vogelbacteria bacterium]|nr:glycosyltransferase family 4 protein [Candidatus Vogelbacteria bacterium]